MHPTAARKTRLELQRHARSQRIALAEEHAKADPAAAGTHLVDEQLRRRAVVDHHGIGVAIVVEITEGCAAADVLQSESGAALGAYLHEPTAPDVAKELIALAKRQRLARALSAPR